MMKEATTNAAPKENSEAQDPERRNLALALLGALGGAAFLDACTADTGAQADPELVDRLAQAASGSGALKYADSVAELRLLTGGASGWIAILHGYSSKGDGGGGVFFWETSPALDDKGTFFNNVSPPATAAGWKRIYADALNVRWFGAKGNGIASDDVAINAAVTAAASSPGSAVFLPPGNYKTVASINVPASTALRIYGAGEASRINAVIAGTNTAALQNTGALVDFELSDLRIDGSFSRGVALGGSSGAPGANIPGANIRVLRCNISGATVSGGTTAGILVSNANDVRLCDNLLWGNGVSQAAGIGNGYDINVVGTNPTNARITIRGNTIRCANTPTAIFLEDVTYAVVEGNLVKGNAVCPPVGNGNGYGIAIYSHDAANRPMYNAVVGNTISGTAGPGIYMGAALYSSVTGNTVQNSCSNIADAILPVGAIASTGGPISIVGNIVRTSGGDGIVVQGDRNVVASNVIESCTGVAAGSVGAGVYLNGTTAFDVVQSNTVKSCKYGLLQGPEGSVATNCNIANNTLQTSSLDGLNFANAVNCTISDNIVDGARNCLQLGGTDTTIQGNRGSNATADIIYVGSGTRLVIDNNVLAASGAGKAGIKAAGASLTVTRNAVRNCATGIDVSYASNTRVILRDNDCSVSNTTAIAGPPSADLWSVVSGNRRSTGSTQGRIQLVAGQAQWTTGELLNTTEAVQLTRIPPVTAVQGHLSVSIAGQTMTISSRDASGALTSEGSWILWEIVH